MEFWGIAHCQSRSLISSNTRKNKNQGSSEISDYRLKIQTRPQIIKERISQVANCALSLNIGYNYNFLGQGHLPPHFLNIHMDHSVKVSTLLIPLRLASRTVTEKVR